MEMSAPRRSALLQMLLKQQQAPRQIVHPAQLAAELGSQFIRGKAMSGLREQEAAAGRREDALEAAVLSQALGGPRQDFQGRPITDASGAMQTGSPEEMYANLAKLPPTSPIGRAVLTKLMTGEKQPEYGTTTIKSLNKDTGVNEDQTWITEDGIPVRLFDSGDTWDPRRDKKDGTGGGGAISNFYLTGDVFGPDGSLIGRAEDIISAEAGTEKHQILVDSRDAAKTGNVSGRTMQIHGLTRNHPGLSVAQATAIVDGTAEMNVTPNGDVIFTDVVKETASVVPLNQSERPKSPTPNQADDQGFYSRSRYLTGFVNKFQSATGPALSLVTDEAVFAKEQAATTAINNAIADLYRTFGANTRYPMGEQERIRKEINIKGRWFDSPEAYDVRLLEIQHFVNTKIAEDLVSSKDVSLGPTARAGYGKSVADLRRFHAQLGFPDYIVKHSKESAVPDKLLIRMDGTSKARDANGNRDPNMDLSIANLLFIDYERYSPLLDKIPEYYERFKKLGLSEDDIVEAIQRQIYQEGTTE